MRSGELLGRMLFFKTSIQFRLIPAVMADNVNAASRVWWTKGKTGYGDTEAWQGRERKERKSGREADRWDVSHDHGSTTTKSQNREHVWVIAEQEQFTQKLFVVCNTFLERHSPRQQKKTANCFKTKTKQRNNLETAPCNSSGISKISNFSF